MTRRTWSFPLRGRRNVSTRSLKAMSPTRSLFLIAENARSAQISASISRLNWRRVPNSPDAEKSTSRMTVSSRSSTCFLTYGWPIRDVTFQSIVRTSSPNWYSRTSENSMPRPLKMEWYSPASDSFTSRLVRISIRRIFFRISAGSIGGRALREPGACSSGDFDRVQHPLDDLLRRHVLGLRLVREDDPVAED